ncbi:MULTISPECIES: oxidoreductase [Clostridium]|uniref:FAD-dependent oxidoreductase n=1 Tax=Clostridium frigoriphilum TaxID=443253 RepID=A0ABU7USN6_9CLOT|nr:FAD-dependent oxidoreductase [Clostridium sp. DSM 17811]MBU3101285.1 NAD(P)/FAD-dependent oxidoreductase [Clostridium sp. DSM 17811]
MARNDLIMKPIKVGKRTLRNRVFLAPMGEGMANPDGTIGEQFIDYYAEYAKGGTAVVTPGVICVDYPVGKPEKLIARMDQQVNVKDWGRLAEKIHRYGGLLIPQLHHAGAQTDASITGVTPKCVSDVDVNHQLIMSHRLLGPQEELTTEEVKAIVLKFVNASLYAQLAGCDGVALHGAHGYLINQFLSPATNKRTDEYGGNFENRLRFAREIVEEIRRVCGPNFIIGARIPGHEWIDGALTDNDIDEIARRLEAAGCDYFDVSGGLTDNTTLIMETSNYVEGARVPFAARIKKAVNVPVGAVGKIRHPEFANKVLEDGNADFIIMGRTLICDPEWANKVKNNTPEEIRPCLSCFDGCTGRLFRGVGVSCVLNPRRSREHDIGYVPKVEVPKNIVVVGAGPGGMEAACAAASVNHNVTLIEKSSVLGGQFNLACVPPHKDAIKEARDWYVGELERKNVTVKLNTEATLESISALNPDKVILATGSEAIKSVPIPGVENTVSSWDILKNVENVPEGKNVTIIGGGIVGCEVAELLAENNNNVTILEMQSQIAQGLEPFHTMEMYIDFAKKQVNVITDVTVQSITDGKVAYLRKIKDEVDRASDVLGQSHSASIAIEENYEVREESVDADLIVLAVGQKSVGKDLADALYEAGYDVVVVGDASKPRKFIDAVTEGYFAGIDA